MAAVHRYRITRLSTAYLVVNRSLQMLLLDQELVVEDLLANQQIFLKDSPDVFLVCTENGEVAALRFVITILILIFHLLQELLDGLLLLVQSTLPPIAHGLLCEIVPQPFSFHVCNHFVLVRGVMALEKNVPTFMVAIPHLVHSSDVFEDLSADFIDLSLGTTLLLTPLHIL